MKIAGFLKHLLIVVVGVALVLGIPAWKTGCFARVLSDGTDVNSSASVVLDQPSGNYLILINNAFHEDKETLADWVSYFQGGDITYIFEDISCSVASGDQGAIDMAESFQSKLPENQMSVLTVDSTLLLSRLDCGLFDIIILSNEFAENYSVTVDSENITCVEISGGTE